MVRVSSTEVPSEFRVIRSESRAFGENRDCGVKCLALVCGVPYEVAHARLKELGRRDRKGTHLSYLEEAIISFGFSVRKWEFPERLAMIWSYPGRAKRLTSITSHHPRRYPKQWANVHPNIVMGNPRHVWAFKDHVVHDWSINKSLYVDYVWEVTKI